jgi:hypothetical protein
MISAVKRSRSAAVSQLRTVLIVLCRVLVDQRPLTFMIDLLLYVFKTVI